MKRVVTALSLALLVSACGSDSATAPTPAPTPTPPVATTYNLTGTVSSTTGGGIAGATVRILDGANAGKSTTANAAGIYSFAGLAVAGQSVNASATNYSAVSKGVSTTSNQVLDFQLAPIPLFSRSGVGDSVFDMPTTVSRVRITASPSTSCQNFVVKVAGRLIVNVILGTCSVADTRTHDGTYLVSGGVTEVQISSGVSWTFTEVR